MENHNPCIHSPATIPTLMHNSSGDEDEKKDERRSFKRDFLVLLETRVSQLQDVGRDVILVRWLAKR